MPTIALLLNRLLRRPPPAAAVPDAADAALAAEARDEERAERLSGCGWFDSSHELHSGLVVHEHASADTLGGELPLASWLELQLSGWRAPPQAAA